MSNDKNTPPMKFLHVSTGDNRGAFSGAYRLHRNLIDCGHESHMFVGQKSVDDDTVNAPSKFFQKTRFALEKISSLAAKKIFGKEKQTQRIFKTNIGLVPTFAINKAIDTIKPDLVIVYYIADFLSENQLLEIKNTTNAPVAFYLMDMGMLTGACHYAWDCTGYQTSECKNCPQTDSKIIKSLIARKWQSRINKYEKINPIIVSGSQQLSEQSARSGLTKDRVQRKILMGVNSDTYNPANRIQARIDFSFAPDDIVLYFGAQNIDDKRKGFSHLLGALKILTQSLTTTELARCVLFTIGQGNPLEGHQLPFRHMHLKFISDQTRFSKTYAAADVFICPSVEDSGPMMVNESMMSGTPVIAFDLGVAKDLVFNNETGYKVLKINTEALADALTQYLRLTDSDRLNMRRSCREGALRLCATEKQVESFVALAEEFRVSRI